MTILFASMALNIAQVFGLIFVLVFLGNFSSIDPSSWMALSMASIPFVFLGSLGLRLTRVSRQEVMGLSLVFVSVSFLSISFIFFFLR